MVKIWKTLTLLSITLFGIQITNVGVFYRQKETLQTLESVYILNHDHI